MKNPFRSEKFRRVFIGNATLSLAIIGLVVGAILSWRYNERIPRIIAPAIPYVSLKDLEDNLDAEQKSYKSEISNTEVQINALEDQVKVKQSGMKGLIDSNDALKELSGLTELKGEGIVIDLADSDSRAANPNSIAHASDMRDLVNWLWQNGATAIAIKGDGTNAERVGPTTSIDCIVNTVLINGTKTVPPFQIIALGSRDDLTKAANDKGALKSIYDRIKDEGLKFNIEDSVTEVTVPSFTGNFINNYAKIK